MYKMKNNAFNSLIEQLEQIPSIGKKSASKIAYILAIENKVLALNIANSIELAVREVKRCKICGGLAEGEICDICEDSARLYNPLLCIISSPMDIISIEETHTFNGSYLVISNIKEVDFEEVIANIRLHNKQEIIFAFSPSLVSETMILYIEDKLKDENLSFSKIAQGVPTGVGLDNIDKLSLQRAMESRVKI